MEDRGTDNIADLEDHHHSDIMLPKWITIKTSTQPFQDVKSTKMETSNPTGLNRDLSGTIKF